MTSSKKSNLEIIISYMRYIYKITAVLESFARISPSGRIIYIYVYIYSIYSIYTHTALI